VSFKVLKRPERDGDHLPPTIAKVKKDYSFISLLLLHAIIARTRINTVLPNIIMMTVSRKGRQVVQTAGMGRNEKC
jgi:hypothetical protein